MNQYLIRKKYKVGTKVIINKKIYKDPYYDDKIFTIKRVEIDRNIKIFLKGFDYDSNWDNVSWFPDEIILI